MHHNQAQFLGGHLPFGHQFGAGNYGISNLGVTSVNPLTGQYLVQFVPGASALNNNVENAFSQPAFWGGSYLPSQTWNGWTTPWSNWSAPWSNWTSPWSGTTSFNPTWNQSQAWGTPWNSTTWNNPTWNWGQGYGSQWTNQQGTSGSTGQTPAVFVTPTGWQNVGAWTGQNVNGLGQCLTCTGANVRYIHNDFDTVIEISMPGVNTETLELISVGNEIRIRQAGGRTQGGNDISGGYLSIAIPGYSDGTQLQAQAAGDYLRITVPTRKEITSQIKKVKPSRVK